MTLFISSSEQEKSPYTVSRSTSLGQAPSCVRLPERALLVAHAYTYIYLLSFYLFLFPSVSATLVHAPISRCSRPYTSVSRGQLHVQKRIRVQRMASRSASPRYWRAAAVSPRIRAGRGRPQATDSHRGEQTGSSRPLYTTLHIARSSGSRPVDARRSTQSVFDCLFQFLVFQIFIPDEFSFLGFNCKTKASQDNGNLDRFGGARRLNLPRYARTRLICSFECRYVLRQSVSSTLGKIYDCGSRRFS